MRNARISLALCLVVILIGVACNGDSSSTGPTPTTPTTTTTTTVPLPPADAELEFTGKYKCIDPWCDAAEFEMVLTNTGGVGADIICLRGKNKNAQTVIQLCADHFVNNLGTNRVEAGGRLEWLLRAQLVYVYVIEYRDDNRVHGEVSWYPNLPR
jgi:hypothetical protein